MKREYLDALIESYWDHLPKLGKSTADDDAHLAIKIEISRLCGVQRGLGLKSYLERLAVAP